ncbi:nucleotide sugar dehydrogenase [Arthrobacter sp. PGP41]|uniref:nucleotide sugar dehydrogenase n=1 Tax=Arthrobacter sp. PGP41 TaxID=2079227 RepID=UPI000CDC86E0|nr:nucleotide sugar dehydrogenase [Arthrobacter sp. PGP41]AUZ35722.1 nucleotide sugar dehydrogenase [Arthrobacter sp. PGP41]
MPETKVIVVGQGYVGLPVAMLAAGAGFDVVGIDTDKRKVDWLNSGRSYVEDISDEQLLEALNSNSYRARSDYSDACGFSVAVITVPTPLTESRPDLSYIEDAARELSPHVTKSCTVILESTTYPGTTEQLLVPILEQGSGLKAGIDFFVGYSPERIDPGNAHWNLANTPKVVSGICTDSLRKVQDFYNRFVRCTVPVSSPKEAELTKLLENTFRHVNIALVNELAVYANELGINIWESIEAASSKPFGYMKFVPGPGVGGHCLPVDPSYLSWEVRRTLGRSFRFVELANDINDHMPEYVVQRLSLALNKRALPIMGSRILMIGFAYKRDSGDLRESPAEPLARMLQLRGANLRIVEPHLAIGSIPLDAPIVELTESEVRQADAVLIVTDHSSVDYGMIKRLAKFVLDTRNVIGAQPNVDVL